MQLHRLFAALSTMSVRNGAMRRGRKRGRDLQREKRAHAEWRAEAAEAAVSEHAEAVFEAASAVTEFWCSNNFSCWWCCWLGSRMVILCTCAMLYRVVFYEL